MMKRILLAALGSILLLTACKPTEKNYQSAYEKAHEAAVKKSELENTSVTGNRLESIDGARREVVGQDTVVVGRQLVKPFESEETASEGRVGIAIAKYKMPTNARRHLQDVKKEYPEALVATDGQDNYYVMIKRVASLDEAVDPIRVYELKHPDFPYMGLEGSPVVFFFSPR